MNCLSYDLLVTGVLLTVRQSVCRQFLLKMSTGHTNAGKAKEKAGAYGCSELGSQIGGAVGPPVIGSLVGTLVGEMIGEKTMDKTGVNEMVSKAGDKLVPVIGRRNVNKLGDMTMTAFGYGDSEVCVCCPCLPASQVLLVVTIPFFFFNLIKFGNPVQN